MQQQAPIATGASPAMNSKYPVRLWSLLAVTFALLLATASADPDFGYPSGGGGSNDDVPDAPVFGDNTEELILGLAREQSYVQMSSSIRWLLSTMVRRQGRGLANLEHLALNAAGPEWGPVELTASGVWGDIELSDLDVHGYWHEEGVGLASSIGNAVDTGLSLNVSRTILRGRYGCELTNHGVDAYLNVLCPHGFGAGLFVSGAQVDLEDRNDNGGIHGAGLSLSSVTQMGTCDLSAAVSVSRFLRDIETREYDTLLTSLVDLQTNWTEKVGTSVYAFLSDSLERDLPGDRTFGSAGLDLVVTPSDRIGFTVGVEKMLGLKDHREYRLNASLLLSW